MIPRRRRDLTRRIHIPPHPAPAVHREKGRLPAFASDGNVVRARMDEVRGHRHLQASAESKPPLPTSQPARPLSRSCRISFSSLPHHCLIRILSIPLPHVHVSSLNHPRCRLCSEASPSTSSSTETSRALATLAVRKRSAKSATDDQGLLSMLYKEPSRRIGNAHATTGKWARIMVTQPIRI